MNGNLPIDTFSVLESFRKVRNPQLIESDSSGNSNNNSLTIQSMGQLQIQSMGYWETVFGLVMEGKLMDVWEFLTIHGDLKDIITGNKTNSNPSVLKVSGYLKIYFNSLFCV